VILKKNQLPTPANSYQGLDFFIQLICRYNYVASIHLQILRLHQQIS